MKEHMEEENGVKQVDKFLTLGMKRHIILCSAGNNFNHFKRKSKMSNATSHGR